MSDLRGSRARSRVPAYVRVPPNTPSRKMAQEMASFFVSHRKKKVFVLASFRAIDTNFETVDVGVLGGMAG